MAPQLKSSVTPSPCSVTQKRCGQQPQRIRRLLFPLRVVKPAGQQREASHFCLVFALIYHSCGALMSEARPSAPGLPFLPEGPLRRVWVRYTQPACTYTGGSQWTFSTSPTAGLIQSREGVWHPSF